MDLVSKLAESSGEWLTGEGAENDIVISTRVRLARNVEGFPFVQQLPTEQKKKILAFLQEKILTALSESKPEFLDLETFSETDLQFFVERQIISKEHASVKVPRGVVFPLNEHYSIMLNEEDHLRIQVIRSGFQLEETWGAIQKLDEKLEDLIDFSFSPQFGYLTACPTNVGTGIRVSVMMHLPALSITKNFEKVCQQVQKVSLMVRGLYGEGTQATGHFYQISNQITLGLTEEEIVAKLHNIVPQIIKYERGVRETLINENLSSIEDRVWRSFGILKEARSISSKETMELLSNLRLGVNLGLIPQLKILTINKIFLRSQPAHLSKLYGKELEAGDRDAIRAQFIRQEMNSCQN
ncbi:MAG: protein arginine kinase [Planctomycetota bacterium]